MSLEALTYLAGQDLLQALYRKNAGPLIYEYPVRPYLPPRLPSPDTVGADTVSIAILWVKKVKFSHTRYRALGPGLIPVYRQSARR